MEVNIVEAVVIILTIGIIILSIAAVGIGFITLRNIKYKQLENELKLAKINLRYEQNKIKFVYSKDILDFINKLTSDVSVLKYREFRDNRDMSKITRENIRSLTKEVVSIVRASLNRSNVDMDSLLFTEDYYNRYIIDTSIFKVKELFEKDVEVILNE